LKTSEIFGNQFAWTMALRKGSHERCSSEKMTVVEAHNSPLEGKQQPMTSREGRGRLPATSRPLATSRGITDDLSGVRERDEIFAG
jgi:hypothetical protein